MLLDSLRSAYNVGSIFRTCDSLGVDKLLLTGYCVLPPHPKLNKTALGSINSVHWEHHCSAVCAVNYLKSQGISIICFEVMPRALPITNFSFPPESCLVFGNEKDGITKAVLDQADYIVKIPQQGIKESLNVASAAAIGIYEAYRQLQTK